MEVLRNWGPSTVAYFGIGVLISPLPAERWVAALVLVAAVDIIAYLRGLYRS